MKADTLGIVDRYKAEVDVSELYNEANNGGMMHMHLSNVLWQLENFGSNHFDKNQENRKYVSDQFIEEHSEYYEFVDILVAVKNALAEWVWNIDKITREEMILAIMKNIANDVSRYRNKKHES